MAGAAVRPIACAPATGAISRSRAGDGQSRAASCNSFCPASETKVVYGSSIDHAATENGKPYSELPNAFRYRNELVAGCTCNGKDQLGLAPVKIEDDPTLRKGDIVAGANGLVVAARASDRRGASLNFSPASASASREVSARARGGGRISPLPLTLARVPAMEPGRGSGVRLEVASFRFVTARERKGLCHVVLIGILITFLVVILVLYLINMLPLDGRAKQIARVIVIIIGIISLLKYLSVF